MHLGTTTKHAALPVHGATIYLFEKVTRRQKVCLFAFLEGRPFMARLSGKAETLFLFEF
jgi:hypothetical protein